MEREHCDCDFDHGTVGNVPEFTKYAVTDSQNTIIHAAIDYLLTQTKISENGHRSERRRPRPPLDCHTTDSLE